MPVIINEFEVVPDTAPPPRVSAERNADAETKQKEKPNFADVLRHLRERAERIRAH